MVGQERYTFKGLLGICILVIFYCLSSSLYVIASSGGGGSPPPASSTAVNCANDNVSWVSAGGHDLNSTIRTNGYNYYKTNGLDCSGMVKVAYALQEKNPPNWDTATIYNDTSGQYDDVSTGNIQVGDVAVWDGHMGMVTAVHSNGKVNISHVEGAGIGGNTEEDIEPAGTSRWGTGGDKSTKYKRYNGN